MKPMVQKLFASRMKPTGKAACRRKASLEFPLLLVVAFLFANQTRQLPLPGGNLPHLLLRLSPTSPAEIGRSLLARLSVPNGRADNSSNSFHPLDNFWRVSASPHCLRPLTKCS